MIRYYTNRELAHILGINLARWKRWSREFLPPDPLGGLQSGYARQYAFKDLFKVYLGGHLLSHLKLSLPESRRVLGDLTPWLKKNGFLAMNMPSMGPDSNEFESTAFRIFFAPAGPTETQPGPGFHYLIRQTVGRRIESAAAGPPIVETIRETGLSPGRPDRSGLLADLYVRMINLTALSQHLTDRLGPNGS